MTGSSYNHVTFETDPLLPDIEERLALVAPIIGRAAHQLSRKYQVPYSMALAALLTAASTAVQGLVDLRTPDGRRGPVSLAILLLAKSGERKTTILKRVMKAVDAFEDVLADLYSQAAIEHEAALRAWKQESRFLQAEIRRARRADEDTSFFEEDLVLHERRKPIAPCFTSIVYQDCSPMAMFEGLSQHGLASLISSEGWSIIDGKPFEDVPLLNSAYSGESITVKRSRRPPLKARDPRLTMCIMVQPDVFKVIPEKRREIIRGSGLWARFLVLYPESMQGMRLSSNAVDASDRMDAFDARLVELLEMLHAHLSGSGKQRDVVEFSPDAQNLFIAYSNYAEREMAHGGRYAYAGDHGSKLAENVARLAALMHFFEGFEGSISVDLLKVAIHIVDEASRDFMNVFAKDPEHVSDAKLFLDMMERKRVAGRYRLERGYALSCAPLRMRKVDRFNRALSFLQETYQVCSWGESDGKTYIALWDDAPPYATGGLKPWGLPVN